MRKLFPLFSLVMLTSLMLAACGTPVAATPVTVEVTRIVTAAAPATGAETATTTTTTGGETPTAEAPPVAGAGGRRPRGAQARLRLLLRDGSGRRA